MRSSVDRGDWMAAQQLNVEVIANNIANINTTGFKRARAEFTDLIYQSERLSRRVGVVSGQTQCPKARSLVLVSALLHPQT